MSNELNEKNYRSSFRRPHAESDQAITDAGNVSGIVIKDGHVSFTIEIDPKDKDKADELRRACEQAVLWDLDDGVIGNGNAHSTSGGTGFEFEKADDHGTLLVQANRCKLGPTSLQLM